MMTCLAFFPLRLFITSVYLLFCVLGGFSYFVLKYLLLICISKRQNNDDIEERIYYSTWTYWRNIVRATALLGVALVQALGPLFSSRARSDGAENRLVKPFHSLTGTQFGIEPCHAEGPMGSSPARSAEGRSPAQEVQRGTAA